MYIGYFNVNRVVILFDDDGAQRRKFLQSLQVFH
jgi:hypothetical protein